MMRFDPRVYFLPAGLSFAGAALVVANAINPIWGETEPYWDTDCSEGAGYFLVPIGVLLALAFVFDWHVANTEKQFDQPVNADVKKAQHAIHMVALVFVILGAAWTLGDTAADDFGFEENPAEMRGARALQGVVLACAIMLLAWHYYKFGMAEHVEKRAEAASEKSGKFAARYQSFSEADAAKTAKIDDAIKNSNRRD